MSVWLRSKFSIDCILEVHSERFRVRSLSGELLLEFEPILALDRETRVVSIGMPIAPAAVETIAPYAAPSRVAEHRRVAELLLRHAYSKLSWTAGFWPAPGVVMHVPPDARNRARYIDDKTLESLSTTAGARKTVIYRGTSLSVDEAGRLLRVA